MAITVGDEISVHYTGKLEDGEVFDSSIGRDPLTFTVGSGQLIPGFDTAVQGLTTGDKTTVDIPAAEGYGERDDARVQEVPRTMLEVPDLETGQRIGLQTPDGQKMEALVQDMSEETITLDFNHFLAGKQLTFEIEVVSA
jgi:FKBP-type peptidyl-prolyl cis-trans isomerase 2